MRMVSKILDAIKKKEGDRMNSYNDLPDAPYIREAETKGMPEIKLYKCPVCGVEYPERFYLYHGEIVGCECCLNMVYAEDYLNEHNYFEEGKTS